MSIEEVLAEPDPKSRMVQMCGYLSALGDGEMPAQEVIQCVDALIEWAKSGDGQSGSSATFREELTSVINSYSMENGSNTPDFILAKFMAGCLASFNTALVRRAEWYGKPLESVSGYDPTLPSQVPKPDEA